MLGYKKIAVILIVAVFLYLLRLKSPWLEWNDLNHELNGKTITFSSSMSYVELTQEYLEDDTGFFKEEIAIGRWLVRSDALLDMKDLTKSSNVEVLPFSMTYTIRQTYWHRHNWLQRSFSGNTLHVLLEDAEGFRSIAGHSSFVDSSYPKLAELEFIYKEF
jgi:hypothetical protein